MQAGGVTDRRGTREGGARRGRPLLCALALVAALAAGLGAGTAQAGRTDDHDRAREALEAGEILPLGTILARIEREFPGRVLDVDLEREHEQGRGRWMYRIKLLRAGGTRMRIEVDARDGTIIAARARPRKGD